MSEDVLVMTVKYAVRSSVHNMRKYTHTRTHTHSCFDGGPRHTHHLKTLGKTTTLVNVELGVRVNVMNKQGDFKRACLAAQRAANEKEHSR